VLISSQVELQSKWLMGWPACLHLPCLCLPCPASFKCHTSSASSSYLQTLLLHRRHPTVVTRLTRTLPLQSSTHPVRVLSLIHGTKLHDKSGINKNMA
jgi:hypothetical protein